MPKTKGATSWSLDDVKCVAHTLRNKKKFSINDPDVIRLSEKLDRPVRGIERHFYTIRSGTSRFLKTEEGVRVLGQYVKDKKLTNGRRIKDRISQAVKALMSDERMMKVSDHHKLITNLSNHHKERLKDMVVTSYAWGYNQGLADFRGKFLNTTKLDKEIPDVSKELMMETSKILFDAR